MKRNFNAHAGLFIALIMSLLYLNTALSAEPTGTKIYPKISNATVLELGSGSNVSATWPVPLAGRFKLWVQVPTGSNASQVTYFVYPKGNAVGSNACSPTDPNYPCEAMTIDQSTVTDGWIQLTLNDQSSTSWPFAKTGYVTVSATGISNHQEMGVAQLTFQAVTPTPALAIGQTYQGGKIFYLDSTRQHGLIAAPSDQSVGIRWDNGSAVQTGATGLAIGTGKANTAAIVQALGAGN